MTGLEKILSQISEDAKSSADEIINEGKKKADEIIASAKADAKKQADIIATESESKASDLLKRAESAALLQKRNKMLAFKQDYIGKVLDDICHSLENSPADEYFDNLINLVSIYAKKEDGSMLLNAKDLARLPADFSSRVNSAAGQKIEISDIPCNIDGGFLLVYEGIDVNCSFRAIFEDKADSLRDIAGNVLFPAN